MNLVLSTVLTAALASVGPHFSSRRVDLQALGNFASPVMGFDHYRMNGPIFSPHPHAGFSAVSYVFENSAGGLRNRDSLRHDLVIEPGAMVWTQAGSGVVHDEFPARVGHEVHGVQIFVNLPREKKDLPPQMLHLGTADVPVVVDTDGNRTRVLSGCFSGAVSPVKPAEPFDLLDVTVTGTWRFRVPTRRNVLVYVLSGAVDIAAGGEVRQVQAFQAVAGRASKAGDLQVKAREASQLLLLSGTDPGEPVAVYGPFIMNDQAQLAAAFERYRNGEMGRLSPIAIDAL
ncbi:pirin family protein [Salmonella enterica]|nr:pirin family protein [Salmonella enterica]